MSITDDKNIILVSGKPTDLKLLVLMPHRSSR